MRKNSAWVMRQRGAALLLLMLVVIVAMSSLLLSGSNRNALKLKQLTKTRHALAVAKEALINYAVLNVDLNADRSISLPCPDIDDSGGFLDGQAHASACGLPGTTVIGRLPWRTLGIMSLKDASAACLWYAVSGSYKDAGPATAAMINIDTNGQLQLHSVETGNILLGSRPNERPVAFVIAGMQPLNGQTRPPAGIGCAPGAVAASFLDIDAASGIANFLVSGVADGIDLFATTAAASDVHNDRIVSIARTDIASRLLRRSDFDSNMRALGLAAAECLADYAANNPGGADDKRLPWPAPVPLADYRQNIFYDDDNTGILAGRMPDIVDDSSAATNNAIARTLSDCNSLAVPSWTAARQAAWRNWKDHFFYAVADSYSPSAITPSVCSPCLSVNGAGQYAALLVFSNNSLESQGQLRNAPPTDADTKRNAANYLEGGNASNVAGFGTSTDYRSQAAGTNFNDLLFCIDNQLVVTEC